MGIHYLNTILFKLQIEIHLFFIEATPNGVAFFMGNMEFYSLTVKA